MVQLTAQDEKGQKYMLLHNNWKKFRRQSKQAVKFCIRTELWILSTKKGEKPAKNSLSIENEMHFLKDIFNATIACWHLNDVRHVTLLYAPLFGWLRNYTISQ